MDYRELAKVQDVSGSSSYGVVILMDNKLYEMSVENEDDSDHDISDYIYDGEYFLFYDSSIKKWCYVSNYIATGDYEKDSTTLYIQKSDGTFNLDAGEDVTGQSKYEYSSIANDIVAVKTVWPDSCMAALKKDGSLVLSGWCIRNMIEENPGTVFSEFSNFLDISSLIGDELYITSSNKIVALHDLAGYDSVIRKLHEDVFSQWTDIVDGTYYGFKVLLAITDDGKVLVDKPDNLEDKYGQYDVADWENVTSIACGDTYTLGVTKDGKILIAGKLPTDNETALKLSTWKDVESIASGGGFVAGLKSDGTVYIDSVPYYMDDSYDEVIAEIISEVSHWKNITKITACDSTIIGLKKDGTVELATDEDNNETNKALKEKITSWKDIVDIYTDGLSSTVALLSDGTLVYSDTTNDLLYVDGGFNYDWTGVKSIKFASCSNGLALLAFDEDGRLLNNNKLLKSVSSSGWLSTGIREDGSVYFWGTDALAVGAEMVLWKDIKQVCPGDTGAVGLKEDGTVVFARFGHKFEGDAGEWTDIDKLVLLDNYYLAGIKQDNTVVVTGEYLVDTSQWSDIIDVLKLDDNIIGLKSDGTVVATTVSDTLNESYDELASVDESELPLFDNGWLTFTCGGQMYVPENFVGCEPTDSDYSFSDSKTDMCMTVSSDKIYRRPDVKSRYTDTGYEYYFEIDGQEIDFLTAQYNELSETYSDASTKEKTDNYFVFSGTSGDSVYYVRYEVNDSCVYILNITYPVSNEKTCSKILKQIESDFLA